MKTPLGTLLQFLAFQTSVLTQEKLSRRCTALWAPGPSPAPETGSLRARGGARLRHPVFWALKPSPEPCPCFTAGAAAGNRSRAMREAKSPRRWPEEHPAGRFEGHAWSKTLPILGDGRTHHLGAGGSGERLEEPIWRERAFRDVCWDPRTSLPWTSPQHQASILLLFFYFPPMNLWFY